MKKLKLIRINSDIDSLSQASSIRTVISNLERKLKNEQEQRFKL
jgi:hypothetical protein